MTNHDPDVEADRARAKERGRAEPHSVGALMQQVLDAVGLQHVDVPQFSDPDELAQARREFHQGLPPQRVQAVPKPNVPSKFSDVRFGNSVERPETENWHLAMKRSKQWVDIVANGNDGRLALIGPKGNSKSHLAYCAAWELYEQHNLYSTCFSWVRIVDRLRWGSEQAQPLRERLMSVPILILDEVRPTSGSEFDAMELSKISMVRYDDELPTFVTCNWESLEAVMGEPAADRYTQVVLDGPSFRSRDA